MNKNVLAQSSQRASLRLFSSHFQDLKFDRGETHSLNANHESSCINKIRINVCRGIEYILACSAYYRCAAFGLCVSKCCEWFLRIIFCAMFGLNDIASSPIQRFLASTRPVCFSN